MEVSSQLTPWRNPKEHERVIRPYYRSAQDMPFHSWDHALVVRTVARRKADKAASRHPRRLDRFAIDLGALAHDTEVWKTPGLDYPESRSKEEHSALLAGKVILPRLKAPLELVEHTVHIIRTTERDVRFEDDDEAKCVCQGDMWSVISEDSRDILLGTVNFFKEQKILQGTPVVGPLDLAELTACAAYSYDYLQGFIEEELSLGPWDRDSEGFTMSQRGHINVEQLRPARFPNLMRSLFPRMLAVA